MTNRDLPIKFSYNPLWKMLIDRNIQKKELQQLSGISSASIAKLGRCGNVTTDVLLRICNALNCDVSEIMEVIPKEHA